MDTLKSLAELRKPRITEVGGKGYSLGVLVNNRFNVPRGFVITTLAFFEFLDYNNIRKKIGKLASEIGEDNFRKISIKIRQIIVEGKIQKDAVSKIKKFLNKLNAHQVSIRSSAPSEDSLKASFAGMYDTYLNVKAELPLVLRLIKRSWASLFNERAVIYRLRKELPHLEGMAVVVQEMIPADVSGIIFTVHPSNEKALLIETSYGLGDMIVSGKVEPDDFAIDRETLEISEKKIGKKTKMSICKGGKVEVIDVERQLTQEQVISDEKIKEIAKTCLEIEKIFNYPLDIEWCISNKKVWWLQSRAITGVVR